MNRDILEAPFAPEQIKQREGNFGKMLDYIEGHAVIQRLNDSAAGYRTAPAGVQCSGHA